jgi:predicted nucleic acid-binding protein
VLVVDSSVWVDFFNNARNPSTEHLEILLEKGEVRIVVPDLILFEVLRGFRHEHDYRQAKRLLETLTVEVVGGRDLVLEAAQHYRSLRSQGFTVRSPIDVLVAAFCIENDYSLLHRDRDFNAFEDLRGLRAWRH